MEFYLKIKIGGCGDKPPELSLGDNPWGNRRIKILFPTYYPLDSKPYTE